MKLNLRTMSAAALIAASISALAGVPDGYYNSLEGKSGVALKNAVKALALPHKAIHYGEDTEETPFAPAEIGSWTVFKESDTRTIHDNLVWWDMYSDINMRVADGHNMLNIEHSVPNSWWGHVKNDAYKDLHHLNPSNAEANGKKSNWPLGHVATSSWTNGVSTTGSPAEGEGGDSKTVYEPHDTYKGDFARAYFYVFTVYDDIPWLTDQYTFMYDLTSDLTLQPWAYNMLLDWAKNDPVSNKEMNRNETIYKYQENRNPFIDCPELAEHIWGSKKNEPFHYALYAPAQDDPDYPGWDQDPVEMIEAQWQPIASEEDINEDLTYLLCSLPDLNRIMANTMVSGKNAMAECVYSPTRLRTYPDIIEAIPADAAFVKLEKSGDNWVMAVYDNDDQKQGYINYKTGGNTVELKASADAQKAPVTISVAQEGNTVIQFVNYTDFVIRYNSSNSRFSAYKGTVNPVQLYRPATQVYEDPEEEEEDPDYNGIGSTGLDENENEVILGIYEINGRRVNASSTLGLDKGIYIVVSNFGTKKIKK